MFPAGHSRRFAGRTLLIIFAIVAIVSAVYQIATRTDVGRHWLETKLPPKQPDLVSQIGIVGFQLQFEYGVSHTAWADFTIVNDNPFRLQTSSCAAISKGRRELKSARSPFI